MKQSAEKDEKRRKEDGVQCSHVLALMFAFKCGKFRGNSTKGMQQVEDLKSPSSNLGCPIKKFGGEKDVQIRE